MGNTKGLTSQGRCPARSEPSVNVCRYYYCFSVTVVLICFALEKLNKPARAAPVGTLLRLNWEREARVVQRAGPGRAAEVEAGPRAPPPSPACRRLLLPELAAAGARGRRGRGWGAHAGLHVGRPREGRTCPPSPGRLRGERRAGCGWPRAPASARFLGLLGPRVGVGPGAGAGRARCCAFQPASR